MKLEPRRVEAFLRAPGDARAVLLYGDDSGLIRSRAERLVRAVAGALDDPFRVVDLGRDEAERVPEEMASLSLMGGRRVVRLRDATDSATAFVQRALDHHGDGLLVLEGAALTARSKLRALVEKAPDGVAIGCYPEEGAALSQTLASVFAADRITVAPEAMAWLTSRLGADQALTRAEAEKLALHAGPDGRIDLETAQASVGDLAGLSVEDALFAATSGNAEAADRALDLAIAEGATPVGILRAAILHMQRLERAGAAMADGAGVADAAKAARPPVFFRRKDAFAAALRAWPLATLQAACRTLWETERACKQTGAPDETLCRQAILRLALHARSRR